MLPTHFRRAPWSLTEKHPKNDIFYIGTNMVRMVYLKRRGNHEIAVKTAFDNLPRHRQPTPPPQLITPPPLADTKVRTPQRRWEGSTPKKPPTTTIMHDVPLERPTKTNIASIATGDSLPQLPTLIDTVAVSPPPIHCDLSKTTPVARHPHRSPTTTKPS